MHNLTWLLLVGLLALAGCSSLPASSARNPSSANGAETLKCSGDGATVLYTQNSETADVEIYRDGGLTDGERMLQVTKDLGSQKRIVKSQYSKRPFSLIISTNISSAAGIVKPGLELTLKDGPWTFTPSLECE